MTPRELKLRQKYLGGSEIAAIMGWSPFSSAATLYDEKLGVIQPKPSTDSMDVGTFLEDGVANLWAHWQDKHHGVKLVVKRNKPKVHPSIKFFRASPDRKIIYANGQPDEGLEVKVPGEYALKVGGWGRSGSKQYPLYYKAQCAWNRMIFDFPRWHLIAFTPSYTIKHYVYEPDFGFEAELRDAGLKFWLEHVKKKVRPAEPPIEVNLPEGGSLGPAPDFMRADALNFSKADE